MKDPPVGPGRRGILLPMNVTAELLDTFEFRKKGRGYDSEQVDELIARVRSTLGDLEARLADATARAEAAEARAADAEARSRTSSESDETIQRTLLLAQRTADAAVQEAEETAAKKVGEAELEAKRLVEEADEARARALANAEEEVRRSVDDSRTRLTQEIGALEQIRNTLMTDVERLEEHIEVERSRLRASSDALTDMLSRSDRLGQVELPELSDHDPSVASEVSVDEGPAVESAGGFDTATVGGAVVADESADDDLGWSSDGVDDADGDVVPMAAADEVTAGAEPPVGLIEPAVIEERVIEDEVVDAAGTRSSRTRSSTLGPWAKRHLTTRPSTLRRPRRPRRRSTMTCPRPPTNRRRPRRRRPRSTSRPAVPSTTTPWRSPPPRRRPAGSVASSALTPTSIPTTPRTTPGWPSWPMTTPSRPVPVTAVDGGSAVVADDSIDSIDADGDLSDDRSDRAEDQSRIPIPWALPVVAAVVYVLDQATKHWALQDLQEGPIDLVGSLRLNLAFNTGAAFSGGTGLGPLIAVVVFVVVILLILGRHRVIDSAVGTVAVGMIAGGAVGNLSDRLLRAGDGFLGGAVVDFVDLQWWPVFNVADAAVVVGGLMLVLDSMRAGSASTASSPGSPIDSP